MAPWIPGGPLGTSGKLMGKPWENHWKMGDLYGKPPGLIWFDG